MAIDLRADVTCSLGVVISGSLGDDYLQGSGLIKTQGSVLISGTITPDTGTIVTFEYTKAGTTRPLPRKMRVMSSFADPYRRTTQVELGCKLTYLSDLTERIRWDAFDDPENSGADEDDARIVTIPIYASSIMAECLSNLGITASSNPLTNKFSIAEFDFSSGYVQILSDLLVSESYFGYLDTNEVLQVRSLLANTGTGPVFTAGDIVELGPIGTGQLPGEAVTVSYSTLRLADGSAVSEPDSEEEELESARLNWELEETIGAPTFLRVEYTFGSESESRSRRFNYIPRSTTVTDYDEWDRVTKRTTTTYTIGAVLNTQYYKDAALKGVESFGYDWAVSEQEIVEVEVPEYLIPFSGTKDKPEDYDEVVSSKTEKTEPKMGTLGAAGISTLREFSDGTYFLGFETGSGVTEIIKSSYETGEKLVAVAGQPSSVPVTKRSTNKTLAYGYTQQGQQYFSERVNNGEPGNYGPLLSDALTLVDNGTEIIINTGREVALQSRPSQADRTNSAYNEDAVSSGSSSSGSGTESSSELILALGSAEAQRRIEFSMPYATDDIFTKTSDSPLSYQASRSDAAEKAINYGRIQNRLLLGNRSGINLQVAPERLPAAPFDPIYVQANGLTALYRANGNQWAFDGNGIVCSTDALFWAAVGGTGVFWFPVAPGITTLPETPAIVDGAMNPTTVVLPYNETAVYTGRIRLGNVVTKFEYALELLTEIDPLKITLGVTAARVKLLASEVGALILSGQNAALLRRYRMISAAGSFGLIGLSAGSIRDYVIGTNAGTFGVTGQEAQLIYGRLPLVAEAGIFAFDGEDVILQLLKTLPAEAGTFTLEGEAANFIRQLKIEGTSAAFALTGNTAQLQAEDYFSRWATQTYGFESLVYPDWWAE